MTKENNVDKYKRLISNTAIFAIGTFSSKVLVYLMMPLYTRVLTTGEYGYYRFGGSDW